MEVGKVKKRWERTNVTNLLRNGQSGTYYARVKVNGKEKWRSLKTKVFSVAKLKVGDVEKDERSKGKVAAAESLPKGGEMTVQRFIDIYLARTANDSALRPATKSRREIAVKAIIKTWQDLPLRDARRVIRVRVFAQYCPHGHSRIRWFLPYRRCRTVTGRRSRSINLLRRRGRIGSRRIAADHLPPDHSPHPSAIGLLAAQRIPKRQVHALVCGSRVNRS
jgi:hypothetical protein